MYYLCSSLPCVPCCRNRKETSKRMPEQPLTALADVDNNLLHSSSFYSISQRSETFPSVYCWRQSHEGQGGSSVPTAASFLDGSATTEPPNYTPPPLFSSSFFELVQAPEELLARRINYRT